MDAHPLGYALLHRFVAQAGSVPTVGATVAEDPFDALVAGAGHPEVEGLQFVRDVQAMVIPSPGAAVDDLYACLRLGRLPPQIANILSERR